MHLFVENKYVQIHSALTEDNKLNNVNQTLHFTLWDHFLFSLDSHGDRSILAWVLSTAPLKWTQVKTQQSYRLGLLAAIFPLSRLSSGCLHCPTMCPATAAAICVLPRFCRPAVLKHHGLSSVCLRYRPAPRAFISRAAAPPLSERPRERLAYADCVFVLPAALSRAQTAQAGLEHINHSRRRRRRQLNYKDTQFLLRLIMCGLS